MLKQGVKTINTEFIWTYALSNFILSSLDLMQPRSRGFSLWRWCQKIKRPWRCVWTLRLRSKHPLTQGLRVLFRMWIIWKLRAIILFERNMAERDVCRAHALRSLSCNVSFCTGVLHRWRLLNIYKKE